MDDKEFSYTPNEPLTVPDSAMRLHERIVESLKELIKCGASSPLDTEFRLGFERALSLYDDYLRETLSANKKRTSCGKGCGFCCSHWVEDVNSFELQIIADYIKTRMPQYQIKNIAEACRGDAAAMENLEKIVDEKLAALNTKSEIDPSFILLSSFYQLERPCPLLTPAGECGVYDVRPITCRVYMSLANPERCAASNINDGEVVTCILDFQEEANALLDELHLRFRKNSGGGALRIGILEELSGFPLV
ncbi:MAG: YkgJ family cysteine cluster protein [Chitinispirillales bacterium]|jgi:Fe-S-cluster containining protein|nr:YkgJ family cysteine cluster protein [Chitinispirillales bacterium]